MCCGPKLTLYWSHTHPVKLLGATQIGELSSRHAGNGRGAAAAERWPSAAQQAALDQQQ